MDERWLLSLLQGEFYAKLETLNGLVQREAEFPNVEGKINPTLTV